MSQVVLYEDLKRDFEKDVVRTLRFLGLPKTTQETKKLGCLRKYPVARHKRKERNDKLTPLFCQVRLVSAQT